MLSNVNGDDGKPFINPDGTPNYAAEPTSFPQQSRGNTFGGAETPDDLDTETEAAKKRIEDIEKLIAAGSAPMSRVERAFRESADLNEADIPGWVPREWIYDDDKGDPRSRKNITPAIRRLAGLMGSGEMVSLSA